MTTTTLAIIGFAIWILGYFTIGNYLQKVYFKYSSKRKVPAVELRDDVDFYPANPVTLFGDHWASIAGGAPLTGGATGVMWGYLPAFLYITVGSIFLGAPHDYATLHIAMRNKGKSIGMLIKDFISERCGKIIVVVGYISSGALNAVFLANLSSLFSETPTMTLPTLTFTLCGVLMGFLIYRYGWPVIWATLLGTGISFIGIYLGAQYPIYLPYWAWFIIFTIYPLLSAALPAWVLIEPRNFINFVFLCIGTVVLLTGCIVGNIPIQLPVFLSTSAQGPIWPMLFLTISCGALTGMHSFMTTGYTSRRVPNEKFARLIGYGGLLLEGMTAFIALASAAVLPLAIYMEYIGKGWMFILQNGYANIAGKVFPFIPNNAWMLWAGLLGSIFTITTLEAGVRVSRTFILDFYNLVTQKKVSPKNNAANWTASTIAMAISVVLALSGAWYYIWVLFPAMSSILALMSFMTVIVWLKLVSRPTGYFWGVLAFTAFVIVIPGSLYLCYNYAVQGLYHLAWIPAVALVLTAFFSADFFKKYNSITPQEIEAYTTEEEESLYEESTVTQNA